MKYILTIISIIPLFLCLFASGQEVTKRNYGKVQETSRTFSTAELDQAQKAKDLALTKKKSKKVVQSSATLSKNNLVAAAQPNKKLITLDSLIKEIRQLERKIEQAQAGPIPDAERLERLFAALRSKQTDLENLSK